MELRHDDVLTSRSRPDIRTTGPAIAMIGVGFVGVLIAPGFVIFGFVLAIAGALWASLRIRPGDWPLAVLSAMLAAGMFGYPLFLGGRVLPWVALIIHVGLMWAGWHAPSSARVRIVAAQALAAALAVSLAAAATQFFFPAAWRWVAVVAVALFLTLLCASLPGSIVDRLPTPLVGAIVLVLSEGLIILHLLPTHWVINGAVVALAFAALLERERSSRMAFTSLLVTVFLFGAISSS
ncbi:hypothetical protein HY634_04620 [Candidatus Uhrbacteria bacterium]|nr:hypothetical protein [Candidatus Uhrbacteria bacterium]